MVLFNRKRQKITVSGANRKAVESVRSDINDGKLSNIRISSVKSHDGEWHFSIACDLAETVYSEELLPRLYSSEEGQELQATLEFIDQNRAVASCPHEILMSFRFLSGYSYCEKSEIDFLFKMRRKVNQQDKTLAAVTYYIVSDGCVTICIPAADIQKMSTALEALLKANKIKDYQIKAIDRRTGVEV